MERFKKHCKIGLSILGLSIIAFPASYAATPLDMSKQKVADLASIPTTSHHGIGMQELSRTVSLNKKLHVRLQQTYAGYPILGTDSVLHVAKVGNSKEELNKLVKRAHATMNGVFYQGIEKDLAATPRHVLDKAQSDKALQHALDIYQQANGTSRSISQTDSQLVVYVDKSNKAHYAYKVSFLAESARTRSAPEVPTYILDAATLEEYVTWDNTRAARDVNRDDVVVAGGFGGNVKTGKLVYDGTPGNGASFLVSRDAATATCTMQNADSKLKRNRNNNPDNVLLTFPCASTDPDHNSLYWSGELINANGGYSTANDAMVNSDLVRKVFMDWYGVPVVTKNGQPAQLSMIINYPMSQAIYAGGVLSMGDGLSSLYYPFTTQDIIAHELSHAFTEQHSNLGKTGQAGAIGESFGDITAKAVEFYATGTNSWDFAADVVKKPGDALRFLDSPTKDCHGRRPGDNCSIDNADQYSTKLLAHQAAGVYNRMFYLLSTSPDWHIKKAYNVMVAANMDYWTSTTTFAQGACSVVKAATDYGYDTSAVITAFAEVGIDALNC